MLVIKTALTAEIDSAAAVRDIVAQLCLDALPPNRLGILVCSLEFIESGTVRSLCDSLSFDIVGTTTTAAAVDGAAEIHQLSLMVLASDEAVFSVALSDPVSDECQSQIHSICAAARGGLEGEPSFALTFAPILDIIDDGRIAGLFDSVLGGVPLFGTAACHYDGGYDYAAIVHNGEQYEDRIALVLVGGALRAEFNIVGIPTRRIIKQNAMVTAAKDNLLMEINHLPALLFMESLGLVHDDQVTGLHAIPLVFDQVDDNGRNIPVTRTIVGVSPEGHLVCGGIVPSNTALSLGAQDTEAVVETARECLSSCRFGPLSKGALFFSCHSRYLALGLDNFDEIAEVEMRMNGAVPFLLAYSGGEICPYTRQDGTSGNFSYNNTFIACVFYEND